MKKIILSAAMLISLAATAQENKIAEATKGTQYGAGITENNVANNVYNTAALTDELLGETDSLKNILLEAKVTGVCPKKGCWLTLENDKGITVFVKMKDYAFFLPQSIKGKNILLHADAFEKTTSVKELKHYAEDAKKTQAEIDAITEPKKEIRLVATGIRVLE